MAGTMAGHDDEKESAAQFLQPNNFPRTALRESGNPGLQPPSLALGPRFRGDDGKNGST